MNLSVNICNFCNSVRGVAPLCVFTGFTHTSWVPVEPNATGLLSEPLYVTAERIIQETIVNVKVFKQYSTTPSIYKYSQILKLIISSATALISEFIVFPTSTPTNVGMNEIARILKKNGKVLLTDVIAIREIPNHVISKFRSIGLIYFCYATFSDFKEWMVNAGMRNIEVIDLTLILKRVWEERYYMNTAPDHREAYYYLLDSDFSLGRSIFYIYVKGEKR